MSATPKSLATPPVISSIRKHDQRQRRALAALYRDASFRAVVGYLQRRFQKKYWETEPALREEATQLMLANSQRVLEAPGAVRFAHDYPHVHLPFDRIAIRILKAWGIDDGIDDAAVRWLRWLAQHWPLESDKAPRLPDDIQEPQLTGWRITTVRLVDMFLDLGMRGDAIPVTRRFVLPWIDVRLWPGISKKDLHAVMMRAFDAVNVKTDGTAIANKGGRPSLSKPQQELLRQAINEICRPRTRLSLRSQVQKVQDRLMESGLKVSLATVRTYRKRLRIATQ